MSDITLVKQRTTPVGSPADRDAVTRMINQFIEFIAVDGLGERGKKMWRRFLYSLVRMELGEVVDIKTHKQRSGIFHRRHMLIETRVFEAQEAFEEFEQFRNWLKVGAGYCDWLPGPKGAVIPVPKSIAFHKLEQGKMEIVHDNMIAFLRSDHAGKVLWKHLPVTKRIEIIEGVLQDFKE